MKCQFIISTIFFSYISLSVQNKHGDESTDIHKLADMAASFLKEQNTESIGGMLNNFLQSDGGKQLSDMLLNMNQNSASQILQGVGSLLNQESDNRNNKGFDPSIIGTVLGLLNNVNTDAVGKDSSEESSGMFSILGDLFQQEGGVENLMQFFPLVSSVVSSFTGEEAKKREEEHAAHSWLLPPSLERIHIAFDHFINSDLGKIVLNVLNTQKFFKVFSDSKGNFSFEKFVELLENHSFRKHWLEMVTRKVTGFVAYFADPGIQKKFLTSAQYFINSILKSHGFPKNTLFDPVRPTETLTAFVNYFLKTYFNYKVNAKEYVKPAVKYLQELLALSQTHGIFAGRGIDSSISHKIADTINLEIIEPGAKVHRAYRFAKKNPKCDRYVICSVNQHDQNEQLSLPGLKQGLTMAGSMVAGWFLGSYTQTPFWSFYHTITEETNCQPYYLNICSEFHKEELKVTTEYVHNEL